MPNKIHIKLLSEGYFGKGLTTVESIGRVYNPMYNENGVKIAKDVADEQAAKLKLKAEIGQNERDITKAYTRLGEAYYEAKTNNAEMSDVNDVVDLIRSKKKLVELLKEKLDTLPADKDVVVYCRGNLCTYATRAARILSESGYNAHSLNESTYDWNRYIEKEGAGKNEN